MSATKVTIVRVEEERSRYAGQLLLLSTLFLLGIAVGIIAVLFGTHRLSLPENISPRYLIGAVVSSDGESASSAVSEVESPSPVATTATSPIPPPPAVAPTGRTRTMIDLDIMDRSLAIERLNREIELKKNASIALIADFEKNCGDWSDACATAYQAKLDTYNSDYEALVEKLAEMQSLLDALRAERAALLR